MPLLKNIIDLFSKKLDKHFDNDVVYNVILLFLYSLIGSLLTFAYGVIRLVNNDLITSIIFFLISISLILNYLYFNYKKKYFIFSNFIFFVFVSMVIILVLNGDFSHIGLFWVFLFPPLFFVFFDYKKNLLFSMIFLVIISITKYYHLSINTEHIHYNYVEEYWFISPYLILTLCVFLYQFVIQVKQKNIESDIINNQKNNIEKDEVITKISYQLRTPLNNILGLKNLLEKTNLTDEQKDIVNSIEASIINLTHVIEKVDSATSTKFNKTTETIILFDLYTAISRTLDFYQKTNANIKIDFKFSEKIPSLIYGNPVAIKQIFINLIELAIKYKTNEIQNVIIIVNYEEINQNKIRCNFIFQIQNSSLIKNSIDEDKIIEYSIIKHSIEKLNGKIKNFSQKESTIFEFFIDFVNKTENKELTGKEIHSTKNVEKENISDLKEVKILVAEDNEINQKVIELSLKKYVKIIDFANNGKEALEFFGKNKYDLIIMDIQMPIMDGFKTTQKIREAEIATKTRTPIIAVTANALIHDKKTCLDCGMDDYVAKPYKIQDIIDKIQKLLLKKETE